MVIQYVQEVVTHFIYQASYIEWVTTSWTHSIKIWFLIKSCTPIFVPLLFPFGSLQGICLHRTRPVFDIICNNKWIVYHHAPRTKVWIWLEITRSRIQTFAKNRIRISIIKDRWFTSQAPLKSFRKLFDEVSNRAEYL